MAMMCQGLGTRIKGFSLIGDKEWMMYIVITRLSCCIGRDDDYVFASKNITPFISTIEHPSYLMRFPDNGEWDIREMVTNSLESWFDSRRMMCIIRDDGERLELSDNFCSSS
jgi:hypothetical protein